MINSVHFPFNYLGKLTCLEVYDYYDKPLLFLCRNAAYHLFLVVLAEEYDDQEVWFYVGLSRTRLNDIQSNRTDLHDAFFHAEDGIVYRIGLGTQHDVLVNFQIISSATLSEDLLPKPGEFLSTKFSSGGMSFYQKKEDVPPVMPSTSPLDVLGIPLDSTFVVSHPGRSPVIQEDIQTITES